MPKLILNDGSEVFVDTQTLNDSILPVGEGELVHVGDRSFKKSSIAQILEHAVGVSYQYASAWRRLFAFLTDYLVIFFLSYIFLLFGLLYYVLTFLGIVSELDVNIETLVVLLAIVYFVISFFLFKNTLGGKIAQINIVNTDGTSPSRFKLIFRGIWLVWFLYGSITIFFTKKKRSLHDMVFGTIVTKDRVL